MILSASEGSEPGEVKHLSSQRKEEQIRPLFHISHQFDGANLETDSRREERCVPVGT